MDFNEKQIEILETVEKLISEYGISGTSIRKIAKEAEINIAMVSYYFGSKEKMIESLFQYKIARMNTFLQGLKQEKKFTAKERLTKYLEKYLKTILTNNEFFKIMTREYSLKRISDPIGDKITEMKLTNLKIVEEILEEGFQRKEFQNQVPAEFVMSLVIGSSTYFILNQHMYMNYWGCKNDEEYLNIILEKHLPNIIKSLDSILHFNDTK